jgi:Flp pilus assembly protein TadD
MSPNMAAAHNTLGAVLDRLGQKEAAIAQFEAALQIEPEFEGALRNLNALRAAPAAAEKAK